MRTEDSGNIVHGLNHSLNRRTVTAMTVQDVNDSRARWLALAVLAVAQFMVVLDVTIVNVALPAIQTDLGFSADGLQWVVNGYTLAFGGLLLLGGRARDPLGLRRPAAARRPRQRPPRPPPPVHDRPRALRRRLARRRVRAELGDPDRRAR